MRTLNFNFLLAMLFISGMLVMTSCERNSILEIDEDIDQVEPDVIEGENEVIFKMKDNNTNEVLIDIQEPFEQAIQTYNVYGLANSGFEVEPATGDTSYFSTFAVGVADSIQILWETDTKIEPHTHSFDANNPNQSELFYLITNPVTNESNYFFTMKRLEMSLGSVGAVGDLMTGNFEADIKFSDVNNPVPTQYRNVTVEFSVPRYQ